MSRLYVYALADQRLPRASLHGHRIESVRVGGIYALGERVDRLPPVTEEALREQHAIVLQLAARAPAILPARFGSLVDDKELARIVEARREHLRDALDLVRGREQMTVRFIGEAVATDVQPATRAAGGAGTRYLQRRRLAAGYPLPDAVTKLADAVRGVTAAERAEPGQPPVRALVYHLIDRGAGDHYTRRVADVAARLAPYEVKVSGPWPPFAFAPELLG
jgi:gas vesicle protein GvpL/GvpF